MVTKRILLNRYPTASCTVHQVDDYSLVHFLPLDITDEDSINDTLLQIDSAIQYGEDFEPKEPKVQCLGFMIARQFTHQLYSFILRTLMGDVML